jgi:hypothetical protein
MGRRKKTPESTALTTTSYYIVRRGIVTESEDGEYDVINDQIIPMYCEDLTKANLVKQVYFALLMSAHTIILDPPELENVHTSGYMPMDNSVTIIKHILKDDNYFSEAVWIEEFSFTK